MESMKESVTDLTLRVLNSKFSVSTWLWVFVSLTSGIYEFLALIHPDMSGQQFLLSMPLINGQVWAAAVVITSLVVLYGLATTTCKAIGLGAFASFIMWVFGFLTLIFVDSEVAAGLLAVPLMILFAYLFLGCVFRDQLGL